ncbi:response regulator transcription factor, partial [Alistipes indistinctus]
MAKECKIVVVDDHTLFRNGLRTLLDGIEGFSVIGEASNGVELLELLPGIEPDVILLDIEMPKMNGIVTAEEALKRYPDLKIITLSMYGDEDYYFKMVSLGVKGFILKNSEIKEVAAAIETVVGGGSYFSQELLFNLVSNLKSTPSSVPEDSPEELSQRESEILLHICRGESNSEIADSLFISKRTVDKHRSNILAKTG